jgi:hypothetical protein
MSIRHLWSKQMMMLLTFLLLKTTYKLSCDMEIVMGLTCVLLEVTL